MRVATNRDRTRLAPADLGIRFVLIGIAHHDSSRESLRVLTECSSAERADVLGTARSAFPCFEPPVEDPQRYAHARRLGAAS